MNPNVQAYLRQYLQTATKDKVTVEYALHIDRMKLICHDCGMTLTAPIPESYALDYGVQEFIKLHAHTGGHKDKPTNELVQDGKGGLVPLALNPKYVTFDFKPVQGMGMIDDNAMKAAQIKQQIHEYDKELASKMTNEALAKKITELQAQSQQAVQKGEAKVQYYSKEDVQNFKPAFSTYPGVPSAQPSVPFNSDFSGFSKAKYDALKQLMELKGITTELLKNQGVVSGIHKDPPKPVTKKDKPLKIATGRKFR